MSLIGLILIAIFFVRSLAQAAQSTTYASATPVSLPTHPTLPAQNYSSEKIVQNEHTAQAIYRLPAPVWTLGAQIAENQSTKPPAISSSPTTPTIWPAILSEGFEGAFPYSGWTLFDGSNDGYERLWDDVSARAYSGGWSAWPAGGGANGLVPDQYANDMDSWMIYGPFDLSSVVAAQTTFFLWRATEPSFDYLAFVISSDGQNFAEYARWDGSADWTRIPINLNNYVGDDSVWIAWYYHADGSVTNIGAFVDEITVTYLEPCASTSGSQTCTIAATTGWQQMPFTLQAGDQFDIEYTSGDWTIDYRNYVYVGPTGYAPGDDTQIHPGCKEDTSFVYGTLLGRIDNGPPFAVGEGGRFATDTGGSLFLRINDQDGCLGDNDGSIVLTLNRPIVYSLIAGRVTDAAGNPLAAVTMRTEEGETTSTNADGTYSFGDQVPGTHTITASKSGYIFSPSSQTVSIPPDATGVNFSGTQPQLEFSTSTYTVNENGGVATIQVSLTPATGDIVTVNYATSNGTATADSDYTAQNSTLTFAPGQTSKNFTIPIANDTLDEADETVNLTLSSPSNATLSTSANAILTITDNNPPVIVQFSAASYSVSEDGTAATIQVTLNAVSGKTVTLNYATNNGTAIAANDYTPVNGTLTFNLNETSKTFSVPILDDTAQEAAETINLVLSNPTNATLGAASATLTILANDTLASPTPQFSAAPITGDKPLTVNFADQSTGNITSWSWNFGDGATSTQQSPSHTYNTAGDYTVSLTVSGPAGTNTKTAPNSIHVAEPSPATGPSLSFPEVATAPGSQVTLSASYTAKGNNISSLLFSIDYDQTRLAFDPTDQNGDGIPEAIQFSSSLPSNIKTVAFAASDTTGELDFLIADLSASPRTVPDGVIFTITFVASANTAGTAFVNFTTSPAPSFGSATGDVTGSIDGGAVVITGPPASAVVNACATTITLDNNGNASCEISVVVRDAANNPVPNQNVIFTATLGNIASSATTDANGRAVVTFAARGLPGTATVTVQAGNARGSVNIVIEAGPSGTGSAQLYLPLIER